MKIKSLERELKKLGCGIHYPGTDGEFYAEYNDKLVTYAICDQGPDDYRDNAVNVKIRPYKTYKAYLEDRYTDYGGLMGYERGIFCDKLKDVIRILTEND